MKRVNWLFVAAFFVLGAGISMAADAASAEAPAAAAVTAPMWKTILMGAISGGIAALYGWLKNRDSETGILEVPEWEYALTTIVIGMILGAIAGWKGLPDTASAWDWLQNSMIGCVVVPGLEMILKAISRNGGVLLAAVLKVIKGTSASNPTPPTPPTQPPSKPS